MKPIFHAMIAVLFITSLYFSITLNGDPCISSEIAVGADDSVWFWRTMLIFVGVLVAFVTLHSSIRERDREPRYNNQSTGDLIEADRRDNDAVRIAEPKCRCANQPDNKHCGGAVGVESDSHVSQE